MLCKIKLRKKKLQDIKILIRSYSSSKTTMTINVLEQGPDTTVSNYFVGQGPIIIPGILTERVNNGRIIKEVSRVLLEADKALLDISNAIEIRNNVNNCRAIEIIYNVGNIKISPVESVLTIDVKGVKISSQLEEVLELLDKIKANKVKKNQRLSEQTPDMDVLEIQPTVLIQNIDHRLTEVQDGILQEIKIPSEVVALEAPLPKVINLWHIGDMLGLRGLSEGQVFGIVSFLVIMLSLSIIIYLRKEALNKQALKFMRKYKVVCLVWNYTVKVIKTVKENVFIRGVKLYYYKPKDKKTKSS